MPWIVGIGAIFALLAAEWALMMAWIVIWMQARQIERLKTSLTKSPGGA